MLYKLQDNLFTSLVTVDKLEVKQPYTESEIITNLRQILADRIIQETRFKKTETEFCTEYRLDIYILSPNELHRLIREEAMRLVPRMFT